MRTKLFTLLLLLISVITFAQYDYEVSEINPYGKYNAKAPKQLLDYKDLIGNCNCESQSRKPDGTWADPIKMTWKWKYIMNGTAIQDETLKEDGKHSGSIRQFDSDSLQWNVHYYSSLSTPSKLPTWRGVKTKDQKIILYKEHKAPNGTDGFFRITFYDITQEGFNWIGEWTDKNEKIIYPTWKIKCKKETID